MSDPVPSSAIYDATTGGLSVIVITGGSTGDVLTLQSNGTYQAAAIPQSSVTGLVSALAAKADLVGGLVPANQLPSYVDDVVEAANQAALPVTGETGKIYVTLDTGKTYRWSGSAYVELTDSTAVWGQISGTLSNQTDLNSALSGKQATLVSGTNIKTINSTSLLGSGDITVSASPGGSSGQVQWNSSGSFAGAAAVVYATTVTHVTITSQGATIVPVCVKGAASQSGNLIEVRNSAGTLIYSVDASGNIQMPLSATTYIGSDGANVTCSHSSFVSVCRSGNCYGTQFVGGANQGSYYLRNDITAAGFGWGAPGTTSIGSPDTKISRNAAGVVEINNGTNGTFRDLIVRNLRMSAPTLVPASASATGSEGQFAWDPNYIYICVATNTWKRVAIATW